MNFARRSPQHQADALANARSIALAAIEPEDAAEASALRARLALPGGDREGAVRDTRRAILLEQQAHSVPWRLAELQSLLGSECVPDRPPIRPDELSAGEVLLYPVLLPDRIELLYAPCGAGSAGYRRLPPIRGAARADVLALVDAMVDAASNEANGEWRAPARRLYDVLIRPVEPLLRPGGTLIIVPDGRLSALPFAALLDGQGHFLAERSRLAVVPSLAFAQPGTGPARRPTHSPRPQRAFSTAAGTSL